MTDIDRIAHRNWIGMAQPVGLVVSPQALLDAQLILPARDPLTQAAYEDWLEAHEQRLDLAKCNPTSTESKATLRDAFQKLGEGVLGWQTGDFAGLPDGPQVPDRLAVHLPERNVTLRPDIAIVDGDRVVLLVTLGEAGHLERLLRETGATSGVAFDGKVLQLVYAPRGESPGSLTFPLKDMATTLGRELLMAMRLLLSAERLFAARDDLGAVLEASRRYQNKVSTELAEQVLSALIELLRGFGAADQTANGRLLGDFPRRDPDQLYGGLLTVIMRLVFLLYAEDRGLLPGDELYSGNYAVSGLFERLRDDEGRHPDTMDQRFGAWAALLSTFRLIFYGGKHDSLHLPPRHGELFDPERFPFLEGRSSGGAVQRDETQDAPLIPDGTVWRVLENLLMLKGERLSYGALDVEQIGSVYEAMMGFRVEVALKPTLVVRPDHVAVDLADLLGRKGDARSKFLKESASCELAAKDASALKAAATVEQLAVALARRASARYPNVLPAGSLYLVPGEERRRSGSHYTPRELTSPIVAKALEPIWSRLGANPTPQEVLALKVCDPAMGSGAFLVEACRQLAARLIIAWEVHGSAPSLTREEDLETYARRIVARRCLYGVDKNRFAVGLAKLSLWLVTLSKEQAFTFLDHALRHGDSLVGLRRAQIARFTWESVDDAAAKPSKKLRKKSAATAQPRVMFPELETEAFKEVAAARAEIAAGDDGDEMRLRTLFEDAERGIALERMAGDLIVTAFFSADKDKQREAKRIELLKVWTEHLKERRHIVELRGLTAELREGERPVAPFHWEVEFPEVFPRGFDVVVGNPPFMGHDSIPMSHAHGYADWLRNTYEETGGKCDISAFFFRRGFVLLASGGALGLIATNTIAQGDTRASGLRWIATHGGTIFCARKRVKWPGQAAVVVSIVHICNGEMAGKKSLEGREVERITAFLFHDGENEDPQRLKSNARISFQGSVVLGMGFTFDDTSNVASPIARMEQLVAKDQRNSEVIFPFIGGEEVNSHPRQLHHRYIINFGDRSEADARKWPELFSIVEERVRPERMATRSKGPDGERMKSRWWQFFRDRKELKLACESLDRTLAISNVGEHCAFTFLPTKMVFAHTLILICRDTYSAFCSLQSRPHEIWTRFFGSSMKDDLRYTPSDCFETFPFPPQWGSSPALEAAGKEYFEHRAALMGRLNVGMTALYNRFHDPDDLDADITRLRDLHAAMDRAVLDAYGWTDLQPVAEFQVPNADPGAAEPARDSDAKRKRKSPYRLRWRQEDHDAILARLFALNRDRAAEQGGKS